jgi:hypothetical protein
MSPSTPEGPAQVEAEAALGVVAVASHRAAVDADHDVAADEEVDAGLISPEDVSI